MPRYTDYFTSHMFPGDPRTPLTAADACTWPTVPAHRYWLTSDNATGILESLNADGVLFTKATPGVAHDDCQWNMIAGPFPFITGIMWKRPRIDAPGYRWIVTFTTVFCGMMQKEILRPVETCNRSFTIGEMECQFSSDHTGSTFRAEQVVFDKTRPPIYPPP